jgi:hypothetical protein
MSGNRFRQRRQAYARASLIDIVRVLDGKRIHQALFVPVEARAIDLRAPFHDANAVKQHGGLPSRRIAPTRRRLQGVKTAPLKGRETYCMLRDKPRRFGAVLAHKRRRRPSMVRHDAVKHSSVLLVHGLHLGIIALKKRSRRGEALARLDVPSNEREQGIAQASVDAHARLIRFESERTWGSMPRFSEFSARGVRPIVVRRERQPRRKALASKKGRRTRAPNFAAVPSRR